MADCRNVCGQDIEGVAWVNWGNLSESPSPRAQSGAGPGAIVRGASRKKPSCILEIRETGRP